MAAINTTFGFRDQITQSIAMLNRTLRDMNVTLAEMRGQMSGANAAMESVSKSAEKTAGKVGGISAKLLNFNLATQAFSTIRRAFGGVTSVMGEMSAAYDFQMRQETKLATVMRARMGATEEMIQDIKDFASAQQQLGIIGDEVMLAGAQELATYISDANTLKTLLPMLNDIAVQAAQGGEVSAQLETSLATMLGKVMAGDLSGMSKRGWVFTDAEKEAFKAMDEAQRAVFLANYARDAIGGMNADFARTAQGQIMQLNNALGDLKETTGGILMPLKQELTIFKSKVLVDFYNSFNNALQKVVPYIRSLLRAFTEIYGKVKNYINTIGSAVELYLGKAFKWVVENLHSISAAIVTLSALLVAKSLVMAAAWVVANWPIVLGIALVAGFVAAVIKLSDSTEEAGRVIGKVLGGIYAIGYEAFALLWNVVYDFAEFLGNVFDNPVYAIDNLFYQLVSDIIALFKFLPGAAGEWARKTAESISDWSNAVYGGNFKLADKGIHKMEYKTSEEIMQAIEMGGEIGGNFGAKIDSGIDIIQKALKDGVFPDDIKNAIKSELRFSGNGSLSVVDENSVDIADDYRDLLSAKAAEKFNIRLNSMTPQVSVQNLNVNNNDSVESVIAELIEATAESAYEEGIA